ncbi:MAG: hypothetical protein V4681_02710 [Patescibacteria group bacterium]
MLVYIIAVLAYGAAIAATTAAYWHYDRDHQAGHTVPNRWSWLIWGVTTIVEALTFQAISEGATVIENVLKTSVFYVSGICCILVTIRIWRKAEWKMPQWNEVISVIASLAAIVLWVIYHEAWWAHVVAIVAIPVSFIPSWIDARRNPEAEQSRAWGLWTLGDALTFGGILLLIDTDKELPYIITEFGCHAAMWLLVWRTRLCATAKRLLA